MKKISIILFGLYFFIAIYFAMFNWEIFTGLISVNLGITALNIPFVIIMFLMGLLFILVQYIFSSIYIINIERKMKNTKMELNQMKAKQYDEQIAEIHQNSQILKQIQGSFNQIIPKLDRYFNNEQTKPENTLREHEAE